MVVLRTALAAEIARNRELMVAVQKLRDILRELTGPDEAIGATPQQLELAA